ncbi:hypothetical protein B4N84_27670 [Flavobacterium sp. IR1]|nr:hypothetical protein B4N84_27670 [Flavobacterium sp. IR1]
MLQRILERFFPKNNADKILEDQEKLFNAIINALPHPLNDIKIQLKENNFYGFKNWELHSDFKYVEITYPEENYFKYKKRGKNRKISGLQILSKISNRHEDIEILLWDNLIWALKISNSKYEAKEFDLTAIKNTACTVTNFEFPATEVDLFYDKLDLDIQQKLDYNDVLDIDIDGKIFYTFHDLEDGNYLAVDENLIVYSLVHDAKPSEYKMDVTFKEILNKISNKEFDADAHLDFRYKN